MLDDNSLDYSRVETAFGEVKGRTVVLRDDLWAQTSPPFHGIVSLTTSSHGSRTLGYPLTWTGVWATWMSETLMEVMVD